MEGQKTEKLYFQGFRQKTKVKIFYHKGPKLKLLKRAVLKSQEINEEKPGDRSVDLSSVWLVIDRDLDRAKSDKARRDFNQVIGNAENAGIGIAYSNDCFELWFLLHLQDVSPSYLERKSIYKKLSGLIGQKYQKTMDMSPHLAGKTDEAVHRAKFLLKHFAGNDTQAADANPSTTVFKLVEDIESNTYLKPIRSQDA